MPESTLQNKYWLLKAEPDSRIIKGKDVKVSFEFEFWKKKKLTCRNFRSRSFQPLVGTENYNLWVFISLVWMTLNASKLHHGRALGTTRQGI